MKTANFVRSLMLMTTLTASTLPAQDGELEVVAGKTSGVINDVQQARVAMHPATRYMEASSFLLLDLNLEKVEPLKIAEWWDALAPGDQPKENMNVGLAEGILQSIRAAGARHVYVIVSTQSLADSAPVFVIPCEEPAALEGILGMIKGGLAKASNYTFAKGERHLALAPLRAHKRFKKVDRPERADLILPLFDSDRKDHMVVVSIPVDVRAELAAHWPDQFPGAPELDVSLKQLISDVHKATISWDLPPSPQVAGSLLCLGVDLEAAKRTMIAAQKITQWIPGGKGNITLSQVIHTIKVEVDQAGVTEIVRESLKGTQPAMPEVRRNLKQLGLAMHNYLSDHKHFPPRVFTDKEGTPLFSGRVAMLPFIEQKALYAQVKLDKSWDDKENEMVGSTVVPTFSAVGNPGKPAVTRMRFPVVKGSFWEGNGPPRNAIAVRDGLSNTIAIIFAPESAAVPWMSPEQWVLDEDKLVEQVFGDRDSVPVLYFDGSMHVLDKKIMTNKKLKALLTIAGGERIER